MSYPPDFGNNLTYSNPLDLDKIPVFMERSGDNPMFLEVTGLPDVLTFGKHYGLVSIKVPEDSIYQLRNNSELKFEVKDGKKQLIVGEYLRNLLRGRWVPKNPQATQVSRNKK